VILSVKGGGRREGAKLSGPCYRVNQFVRSLHKLGYESADRPLISDVLGKNYA
jgi:hypothetical protein